MTSKWPNYQECFILQAWLNYFNFYRCLQFRALIKWLIRSTSNSAPERVLNWNVALMIHRHKYTQKVHFPCGVLLQVVLLSSQTLVEFLTVGSWGQNCVIWSASLASWIPWVIEYPKTFYLNNTYFSEKVAGLLWTLTATNSLPQLFLNCSNNGYNFAPLFSSELAEGQLPACYCAKFQHENDESSINAVFVHFNLHA